MTLREKLADLISGGALKSARSKAFVQEKLKRGALDKLQKTQQQLWDTQDRSMALHEKAASREIALRTIAAMETPSANATVKRMAKTAREALGE